MSLVDVTVRLNIGDHERDYVSSGSQVKESPAAAAQRIVRAHLGLTGVERILKVEEVS